VATGSWARAVGCRPKAVAKQRLIDDGRVRELEGCQARELGSGRAGELEICRAWELSS
jgi:hypothetical protein